MIFSPLLTEHRAVGIFHLISKMCKFSFSSQPLCVLDTAGCKAVAANPKVLLLSWACKLSAIEIPVGAFGCSCVKTLSGFVVIERVCLELRSVV